MAADYPFQGRTRLKFSPRVIVLLTGLMIFLAYAASPATTIADGALALQVSDSFLHGHGGDLSEYQGAVTGAAPYLMEKVNGRPYSIFPIGTPLMAMPFTALIEAANPSFRKMLEATYVAKTTKNVASAISAIAIIVFGFFALYRFRSTAAAVGAMLLLAFCTSMWSMASRGLWQHGPAVLLLSATIFILIAATKNQAHLKYAAIPLALAYIVRPAMAPMILVFSAYVLFVSRLEFARFMTIAAAIAAPWLAYNWHLYGAVLPPYYAPGKFVSHTFQEALAGTLFSPARGLFVYSPILLFGFYGFWRAWSDRELRPLHFSFGIICVLHWIMLAKFPDWYGGHSYGPRYMTDILPILVYFAVIALQEPLSRPASSLAVLAAASSIFMHAMGGIWRSGHEWNALPKDINISQERLWDWKDAQFLRPLKNGY